MTSYENAQIWLSGRRGFQVGRGTLSRPSEACAENGGGPHAGASVRGWSGGKARGRTEAVAARAGGRRQRWTAWSTDQGDRNA